MLYNHYIMLQIWTYSLISVIAVSLISLVGAIALLFNDVWLKKILIILVGFSAGALVGDAFLHLLPEIVATWGYGTVTALMLIGGLLLFFILEKYVHWRHCHEPDCHEHSHHLAVMNLVGDGFHNFLDGLIIASSYIISWPLGLTTTLAIVLHEIPQEIGDFGVLLHSGFSKKKAIFYNLLSALIAVLGVIFGLLLGQSFANFNFAIMPIAAAGFIYIAMSDLIPELHKETKINKSLVQFLFFLLGIGLMYLFTFFE
jgi:zinc and cadmium transporter